MPSEITENISLVAAEALTVGTFVFVNASGEAAETNAASDLPAGVCMETVAVGVVAPIMSKHGARVPVRADGVHTAGDVLSAGATGEAIAEGAAGTFAAGVALTTTLAANDFIDILFMPHRIHA